jgi:hypothetical protein
MDAALSAVAAEHVLAGTFKAFGNAGEGLILLPNG